MQHLSTPGSSWHHIFSAGQIASLPKLTGGHPETKNLQHILQWVSVVSVEGSSKAVQHHMLYSKQKLMWRDCKHVRRLNYLEATLLSRAIGVGKKYF